jgi:hypothetical protein
MENSFLGKFFNAWGCFDKSKKIIKFTIKCNYCKVQIARWHNKQENDYACEECIPRGCGCRIYCTVKNPRTFKISNYDYFKGKDGRVLPCENWSKL